MNPIHLGTLEALRTRARDHAQAQQWTAAQALLEQVLQQAPQDLASSIELADVLFRSGRLQASTQPLLQAMRRLPRDMPLILTLAQHLIARGEILAARACLDLLELAPEPPAELLVAQANLRFAIGEIPVALTLVEKALAAGADAPAHLHLYAMLLQFSGDIDKACAVLEQCLQRWPQFGDAAMVLVNLRKQGPQSHRLEWLQEQLRQLPAAPGDPGEAFVRAEFEYAAFKTLDDLHRYDEAWAALARCNALMRELNPYDAASEEALTDALVGMPLGNAARESTGFEGPVPIFIVGMPRSGTTLLDRILSSHSDVTSAGEIIDFWRQLHWVADVPAAKTSGLLKIIGRQADIDYRQLGARYLRQTQWRAQGRGFYIDKLPANIKLVPFIRRALPHAPILHMVREPLDTCFSNLKAMFGNISSYSYDLAALAHYYRQYDRQVRHWHSAMPGTMFDVPYDELVRDPAAVITRVLDHCGLAAEQACLSPEQNAAPVATPSSAQVRESIHTRGVGQWRHYAAQLEPLTRLLAEQATARA